MMIPMRMCCVCRSMKPQQELLRVVRTPAGDIRLDPTGKADGRGCYICRTSACIDKGIKTRFVNRAFKCEVPQALYDHLKEVHDAT